MTQQRTHDLTQLLDFHLARPGFEPRSAEGGYEDFLKK
jgi:hypothetical protein